jgi:hypothetical protein
MEVVRRDALPVLRKYCLYTHTLLSQYPCVLSPQKCTYTHAPRLMKSVLEDLLLEGRMDQAVERIKEEVYDKLSYPNDTTYPCKNIMLRWC